MTSRSTNVRRHRIGALCRDERGAALLEFAFVAPVLMALLVGIVDTSLQFFAESNLDVASEKTARLLMTGSAKSNNWTQSQFKTQACSKIPTFMDCTKLIVDVRRASTFSDLNMSRPTITVDANGNPTSGTSYSTGNGGDVMILRLMYLWPAAYAPLDYGNTQRYGGRRLLVATSVFKAEPF